MHVTCSKCYSGLEPLAPSCLRRDMPRRRGADAQGEYVVKLPPLPSGYRVTVRAEGFGGNYLEEESPPLYEITRAMREETLAQSLRGEILHSPIKADQKGELEYDLALFARPGARARK